ncbi:MAG: SpaH/EbpB family LPXTG-anchored major pilin [Actinomycetaceae bacterium]|nr:SpaH/EbpB family LPXTG-anchored major pilin [Actinomycetaceae bacterium]MDY6082730.1 SpaH/EbpB family LPXTG-anchored major pilin [Actinomycetaceae bacterium]
MGHKSLRAIAASALTALALTIGGGVSALAAGGPTGAGNIDVNKDASITIHKLLNPESMKEATGEVDADAKGTPLEGASFTITKLDLDLAKNADLATAAKLTAADAAKHVTETKYDVTTGAEGTVEQKVAVGVYLVHENAPAKDAELTAGGEKVDPSNLVLGSDFVVRVPMTNAAGNGWNYDVHVYPKNSTDSALKTVVDAGKNAGDTISYAVTVAAPLVAQGNDRTKFVVKDDFDETKLENVQVASVEVNGAEVAKDGNYEVSGTDDGTISVTFTTAEGKLVYNIPNNATVTVNITAKIKDDALGEIVNEAVRFDRDSSFEEDQADRQKPTNKVKTYVGKVKVTKQDNGGQTLSGAEFELYRATKNEQGEYVTAGDPIQTLTTGEDGTATTKALHVTDFENNSDTVAPENQLYVLKETKAPAGYVLPEGQKAFTEFTLTRADLGADFAVVKALPAIVNVPSDTPSLPLTGGQGIALFVVLGMAVAGGAFYSARRKSVKA